MTMFERFGNFDSAAGINEIAVNLRKEGDTESVKILAKENGIDEEIAEAFIEGDVLYLCDDMTAAIGKIEVECAELQPKQIMVDWVEYIKAQCFEDEAIARAVRKPVKTLKGCIGEILKWGFKHQIPVDAEIIKAAGVNAGRVTLGMPGMGEVKRIILDFYRK